MTENRPLVLAIDGMHCGGCVSRVAAALGKVAGVTVEKVEVGSAKLAYAPAEVSPAAIAEAIAKIGFPARVAE